jgi:hypothetical protein
MPHNHERERSMKKHTEAAKPADEGNPTVGGVTPANPALDPTTGLPFAAAAPGDSTARGDQGLPTAPHATSKVATVATPAKKAAAKKAPAKKKAAKKR